MQKYFIAPKISWKQYKMEIKKSKGLGLLCTERFFSGYSGFLSPQKPTFDLICVNCFNFSLQCPQLMFQRENDYTETLK